MLKSPAVSVIVNWEALRYVVARTLPLKATEEAGMKPVPLTVNTWLTVPATTEAGDKLEIAGTGLLFGLVTENIAEAEVPPPGAGFVTVTGALPAVPRSLAVSVIFS